MSRKRAAPQPQHATQADIWGSLSSFRDPGDRAFRPATVTSALESVLNDGDAPMTFGRLVSCSCHLPSGPDHCDLHSPALLRAILAERTELSKDELLEAISDSNFEITWDDILDKWSDEGEMLAASLLSHDSIRMDCLGEVFEKAGEREADEIVKSLFDGNDGSKVTKAITARAQREIFGDLYDQVNDLLGEVVGIPTMEVPPAAPEKVVKLIEGLLAKLEKGSKP